VSVPVAPTARAAWQHAALVVLVVATIIALVPQGPWRPAAEIVLFGFGLAGVRTALHGHRTALVLAWRGLGLGLVFFALSCVADVAALAGISPGPMGAVESGLDIAAYAAMVVGALGVVRGGRRRLDRSSWIDTTTLLLAAALALLAVRGDGQSVSADLVEVGIGTPVLTAVLLMVCVPLAMSRGGRSVTTMALLAAGVLTVVGYGGRILVGELRESPFLDPLPLLAVSALVLAGRHPSVATMGRRPASEEDAAATRVLGLGASLLISPALLILWSVGHGGIGYVLGAGSSFLTAMALWRLVALNRDRERTSAALMASEGRLRLLLDNAADVIGIVDAGGSIVYISPAVESLLGRPPAEYLGHNAIALADPRDQPRLEAAVAAAGDSGGIGAGFVDTDIRVQHSSGGTRWVEMRISSRVEAVGVEGWVVNIREVTDRKLFEEELRRQATTDPLTGLLNRTAFSDRLTAATGTIDPAAPPAVLFVDIDDFKTVNDTLGHSAGDELLVTVAARLTADVRAEDVVARLGGDEFAVLLTFSDGERLRDVADRLLTAVRAPIELAGTTVTVTASIGGALGAPRDTAERLLHSADTAMYSAKRSGKDSRALLDIPQVAPA
jgi:diguanylate cyclase (GGDEF)-like protein/PAS domain S-box-containing protein